jgi:hypothetical protein
MSEPTVLLPEEFQLEALRRLRTRLYSERRMSGDHMRDGAQLIDAILASATPLPPAPEPPNVNGLDYYVSRTEGAIYVPLPRAAWRSAGRCDCKVCKGGEGFWDTLAIPAPCEPGPGTDPAHTWTVHMPELQRGLDDSSRTWLYRGRRKAGT